LYLWNLGIISYYGGAVMTQFAKGGGMDEYTIQSIKKALFTPPIGQISSASKYSDADLDWADKQNLNRKQPMHPSEGWYWLNCLDQQIEGQLWGGCLEVLSHHLSVRKYLPDFKKLDGAILYIETSEEMPSDGFVYRFIATLAEIDLLKGFKAILVAYPKAQFLNIESPGGRKAYVFNQRQAIINALHDYNNQIPVIFNMNFGHTDPQIIVPNGGSVKINCKEKTINFSN
jgi:muramoyltetrapeptide carboxypeptidase LdcA involved in peptidoglycan recycling